MVDSEKLKVMVKYQDGFIMSKCQMKTVDHEVKWNFAKNQAQPEGLIATAEIFEEHGYKLVPWDDEVEAFDGNVIFKVEGNKGQ